MVVQQSSLSHWHQQSLWPHQSQQQQDRTYEPEATAHSDQTEGTERPRPCPPHDNQGTEGAGAAPPVVVPVNPRVVEVCRRRAVVVVKPPSEVGVIAPLMVVDVWV